MSKTKKVVFVKEFKFSPDGFTVETYKPAKEAVSVSAECAQIAIENGFAKEEKEAAKEPPKKDADEKKPAE